MTAAETWGGGGSGSAPPPPYLLTLLHLFRLLWVRFCAYQSIRWGKTRLQFLAPLRRPLTAVAAAPAAPRLDPIRRRPLRPALSPSHTGSDTEKEEGKDSWLQAKQRRNMRAGEGGVGGRRTNRRIGR